MCLNKHHGYHGFHLDSVMYGAHPDEKEVLLAEGVKMTVVGIEDIEIDNQMSGDDFWTDFNNIFITVIYLYHN